jgi:hypothetical protein
MLKHSLRIFPALLILANLNAAEADTTVTWATKVDGRLVALVQQGSDPTATFDVVVDNKKVFSDKGDRFVSVAGVFSGDGHTYLLLQQQSGGNGCESGFQAIDLTKGAALVSPKFGNCGNAPIAAVIGGALQVKSPSYKGRAGAVVPAETVTFLNGQFHS